MPGYHITTIKKGELGELSKIREELDEAVDAEIQGCRLMLLLELSDMLGAIEAYLEKHVSGITLDDLRSMSDITQRAFRSGARKSNNALLNEDGSIRSGILCVDKKHDRLPKDR